jgi:hypothetical protein
MALLVREELKRGRRRPGTAVRRGNGITGNAVIAS